LPRFCGRESRLLSVIITQEVGGPSPNNTFDALGYAYSKVSLPPFQISFSTQKKFGKHFSNVSFFYWNLHSKKTSERVFRFFLNNIRGEKETWRWEAKLSFYSVPLQHIISFLHIKESYMTIFYIISTKVVQVHARMRQIRYLNSIECRVGVLFFTSTG
jgi:hypothetical protein